jgi:putative transposase
VEFIRLTGMTNARTAPYYLQSNGKLERYHKTIKEDAIRPGQPKTLEKARAIGYITPADRLAGRGPAIWATRDARLEAAREVRRLRRAELHQADA